MNWWMIAAGLAALVCADIKALIGHSRKSTVTEGYIHKVDAALLAAADRIARHIDDAMTGKKTNKVVPLRKA